MPTAPPATGLTGVRREKRVRLNGVDLGYETVGRGPAVVCIQGVGVPGEGWRPQVEELASRFQMITLDDRGLGKSSPAPDLLTVEAMADDVLAVMKTVG